MRNVRLSKFGDRLRQDPPAGPNRRAASSQTSGTATSRRRISRARLEEGHGRRADRAARATGLRRSLRLAAAPDGAAGLSVAVAERALRRRPDRRGERLAAGPRPLRAAAARPGRPVRDGGPRLPDGAPRLRGDRRGRDPRSGGPGRHADGAARTVGAAGLRDAVAPIPARRRHADRASARSCSPGRGGPAPTSSRTTTTASTGTTRPDPAAAGAGWRRRGHLSRDRLQDALADPAARLPGRARRRCVAVRRGQADHGPAHAPARAGGAGDDARERRVRASRQARSSAQR